MREFSVDDRVWHPEYGWGKVVSLDEAPIHVTHKFIVIFDKRINRHRHTASCAWWELFYDKVELPNPPKPEPTINWSKVPQGTKIQVRDCDEVSWRDRYFLCIDEDGRCWAKLRGQEFAMTWNYCRIHPDVEVKEAWLK